MLPGDLPRRVIDPHALCRVGWTARHPSITIRSTTPVTKVQPTRQGCSIPSGSSPAMMTVMRISKDNSAFLNNPRRGGVFSFNQAIEFSRAATGSNMLVDSLVVFDAPDPPQISQADAGMVHAEEPCAAGRRATNHWRRPRLTG